MFGASPADFDVFIGDDHAETMPDCQYKYNIVYCISRENVGFFGPTPNWL